MVIMVMTVAEWFNESARINAANPDIVSGIMRSDAYGLAEGWQVRKAGDMYKLEALFCPYENMDKEFTGDTLMSEVIKGMGKARLRSFYINGYGYSYQWDLHAVKS